MRHGSVVQMVKKQRPQEGREANGLLLGTDEARLRILFMVMGGGGHVMHQSMRDGRLYEVMMLCLVFVCNCPNTIIYYKI